MEKTKYPEYTRTRKYEKDVEFREILKLILMDKLKSIKYKQSEIEKQLIIISNLYSLDNVEYEFLKYYILKTITPLVNKLGKLLDVSFSEFEIFGTQCLNLKSWVIPQYRKKLLSKGIFIKRGMNDDKIYLNQKIIPIF